MSKVISKKYKVQVKKIVVNRKQIRVKVDGFKVTPIKLPI